MKNSILTTTKVFFLLLLSSTFTNAQTGFWGGSPTTVNTYTNGKIGIGITSPEAYLHINTGYNETPGIILNRTHPTFSKSVIGFQHNGSYKWIIGSDIYNNGGHQFFIQGGSGNPDKLIMNPNGDTYFQAKVMVGGICNTFPAGYNFAVKGKMITEGIKVKLAGSNCWADYVFMKDYRLRPLSEVESYINKHKHLPEIPSAEEVAASGIDLAEIDAKLLQKIEELTLYMIDLKKENDAIKKELAALKK